MKKLISAVALVSIFTTSLQPTLYAADIGSKVSTNRVIFENTAGNALISKSVIYNGAAIDKDVSTGLRRLIYKSDNSNDGTENLPLNDSTNGILSKEGNIGIFSPGQGDGGTYYAPYVPLEFQINVPVGYSNSGSNTVSEIDGAEDLKVRIPLNVTGDTSAMEVNVYGLDNRGESLLGFDIFNSNILNNTIGDSNKKVFVKGALSSDPYSENSSYYPNNENYNEDIVSYFVKKTKSNQNVNVLLGKMNFGGNNGDSDNDGYVGNGFFNGKNGFSINSDMLIGDNLAINNLYTTSGDYSIYSKNQNLALPELYNATSSGGKTYNGEDYESIGSDTINGILKKPSDFLLTTSSANTTIGVLRNILAYGGNSSPMKKSDGFKLQINSDTTFSCADGKLKSLETIKNCVTDQGGSYGMKFFAIELGKKGGVKKVFNPTNTNSVLSSGSGRYVIPVEAKIKNAESGEIEYEYGIPVIDTTTEGKLETIYKILNIGNSFKFIEYPSINGTTFPGADEDSTIIYIPYMLSKTNGVNGRILFQKDFNIFKNTTTTDVINKIVDGTRSEITTSSDGVRLDLTSYFEPKLLNNKFYYSPLFTDGGKYFMEGFGGTEDDSFKILSYNPNVLPYTVFSNSNQNTVGPRGATDPKVITLDFGNDNTSDGVNSSINTSRRFSLNTLFRGTPVSKVFTKVDTTTGRTNYYKTFIVQLKVNGDISLGSNENTNLFLGKISPGVGIHTNPYIVNPKKGEFLSISTRKGSAGFPIHGNQDGVPDHTVKALAMSHNNSNVLRFNEVDGDNRKIDSLSTPSVNGYSVKIKNFETGNTYMNLDTESVPTTPQERLKVPSTENVLVKTPICPIGYQVYQNYKPFYERLYTDFDSLAFNPYVEVERPVSGSGTTSSGSMYTETKKEYAKSNLLFLLNTYGINRFHKDAPLTTYFNYPKPFCVNEDWSKTGNVNDLSADQIATMLSFYITGISSNDLNDFGDVSETINNYTIPANDTEEGFSIGGKVIDTKTQSGVIVPVITENDPVYIHPLNIDQYKFISEAYTNGSNKTLYSNENDNRTSGKSTVFFDTLIKPAFDKLFITDRLIPEHNLLNLKDEKVVEISETSNNLKYSRGNSILANIFKIDKGFANLQFLPDGSNTSYNKKVKALFPVIGATIQIGTEKDFKLCGQGNSYYLAGACFDGNTGNELDSAILKPKDINNNSFSRGNASFDFTKVGRIVSDSTPVPLTSGTTYYNGFPNKNSLSNGVQGATDNHEILKSSEAPEVVNEANGVNKIITNYGRNIGGNIYSFLRLGANDTTELGYFSNDNPSLGWILGNGAITMSGSSKIAAYPFISPSSSAFSIKNTFSNPEINKNIIKVPLFILRNKTESTAFNTIDESSQQTDTSVDRISNDSVKALWASKMMLEDTFEKLHGEYGIYVKLDDKSYLSETDDITGLKYSKKRTEDVVTAGKLGKSTLLSIEYSPNFTSEYNGIQLSLENESFDTSCLNGTLKSSECIIKYADASEGKLYKQVGSNKVTKSENEISDCISNPNAPECISTQIRKPRAPLSDQFTFSQVNERKFFTDDSISVGTGTLLGNALKFSLDNSEGKGIPEFSVDGNAVKTSNGMLARKNVEIAKANLSSVGGVTDFAYIGKNIEETLANSMNYNSLYNDEPVIVTNGRQYYSGSSIVAGGYLNTAGKINTTYGAILDNWTYSDNDNLWADNSLGVNNYQVGIDTSQARRNRIRDEVGNNNHAGYVVLSIPKEKFNSINGILRIAKDSRKFFSNLTIQLPDPDATKSQSKLLNEVLPYETIYSFNNLVVRYGNKYWTWGNNDTSCNKIDPNAVYDRIDKYSGAKSGENGTRSDTITVCLVDKGNEAGLVADNNTITENVDIILPIKPTRGYASFKKADGTESSFARFIQLMNNSSTNGYGHFRADSTVANASLSNPEQRYYVGNINTTYDSYIAPSIPLGTRYSSYGTSPYGMTLSTSQRTIARSQDASPSKLYYRGVAEVNVSQSPLSFLTSYIGGDSMIKALPQAYLNGLTIKSVTTLGLNTVEIDNYLNLRKTYPFNFSPSSKSIYRETNGKYGDEYYALQAIAPEIPANAFGKPYSEVMSIGSDPALVKVTIEPYPIDFIQLPKYDNNIYKQGLIIKNEISDIFKKTGNLQNSKLGNITNNAENYIVQSLKEQEYKVQPGDILTYKISIDASNLNNVPLQNLQLSQVLDRSFDLIPDTLKVEGTNLLTPVAVKPIYNDNAEFKSLLQQDTNTEFWIANTTTGKKNKYELSTSPANIALTEFGDEVVVKKGVLFLQAIDGLGANIGSNTSIRYIRAGKEGLNEDNLNGLYSKFADTDILDGGYSRIQPGDIIIVRAGENISRLKPAGAASIPSFKVLHTNQFTDSMLKYDLNSLDGTSIASSDGIYGLNEIRTNVGAGEITPKYVQNEFFYYSLNNNCPKNGDALTSSGAKTFTGITGTYCRAFNKSMDWAYKGYLQTSTVYNRLVTPDVSNPFLFGGLGGILDIYKSGVSTSARSLSVLRETDRNTDREKLVLANLGKIAKGDKITLEFDVRVNKYAPLNHRILDYTAVKDNGYSDTSSKLVKNDTLLDNSTFTVNDALKIYSHARNTKIWYSSHNGKEEVVYDEPLYLGGVATTQYLTVVPKTNISIVNLSGRKNYYTCDPEFSSPGNCKKISTLDTFDKNDNVDAIGNLLSYENWSRYPESATPLYKGQKILVRVAVDNLYYNLADTSNRVNSATVNLAYNSNYLIFDNATYFGTATSGSVPGQAVFGTSDKTATSTSISDRLKAAITNRVSRDWSGGKETIVKDVSSDYRQVNYAVPSNSMNSGKVYVDFLFTVKHTERTNNIDSSYDTAFNKKVISSLVSSIEFIPENSNEEKFANTETNDNSAYNGSVAYLKNNESGANNQNRFGGFDFSYISIPFDKSFEVNISYKKENKTDFSPDNGKLKTRYFDESASKSGIENTSGVGLAIELTNSKDSSNNTADRVGDFSVTLPYGFNVNSVVGYRLTDIDEFNVSLNQENYSNGQNSTINSFYVEDKLNRKILRIHPEALDLKPGRRYTLYVYLIVDSTKVDPYSSFAVETTLGNPSSGGISLFADALASYRAGSDDSLVKTLPTFAENNVFYGNKYSKNNVQSNGYVDNFSGNSEYYIIGESGKPVKYESSKLEDVKYIDSGNKPKLILDIPSILDENKNTFSVVRLNNGLISPVGSSYNFQNNTVYYYDGDINIGDPAVNNGEFTLNITNNSSKPGVGGVTIIANGRIYINTNIKSSAVGNTNTKLIQNIGFIGLKGTAFNPRATTVEGYFYSPITSNSVVDPKGNKTNYSEGLITTGYANDSLKFKGGVYGGTVWNERTQGCGNNSTDAECLSENGLSRNQVENFTFNNLLYLNPPPVFRKN